YPREVVKCSLKHNAAAVIFAHNHPSGVAEPSHADEILTRSLKAALALVDIQVLDHFIVAGSRTMSFAEHGLLSPPSFRLKGGPYPPIMAHFSRGASHGARLAGNGQETSGGTPRFPRQHQDHTPV